MPFMDAGGGKFKSPSGRLFTGKQVKLYYANGGKFPGQKKKESKSSKKP